MTRGGDGDRGNQKEGMRGLSAAPSGVSLLTNTKAIEDRGSLG